MTPRSGGRAVRAWARTKPVPPGHCPEPIMEIEHHGFRGERWRRAHVWYVSGESIYWRCAASTGSGQFIRCARMVEEYGGKIMEDAADLRLPWSVAPLEGKYYGTRVLDADGEEVIEFWDHSFPSHPSAREKAAFGDWTPEAWADYCCDSHWENERDYVRACAVVESMSWLCAALERSMAWSADYEKAEAALRAAPALLRPGAGGDKEEGK